MCGDYEGLATQLFVFLGSPLHMRGLPYNTTLMYIRDGITPAYAGTTEWK